MINIASFKILHLSDIHIGKTYKSSEDIAYKITSDIDENGLCSLRSVIVTGDIFDGQVKVSDKLIGEAVTFFELLLEQINLNQKNKEISKEDFIFIPGNHDLIRVDNEDERWKKYKCFLSKFYGTIPEYYDLVDFSVFRPYHEEQIVFIGFNSCQIEKKKVFCEEYIRSLDTNISSDKLSDYGIDKRLLLDILKNEKADEYDDYGHISMAQITRIRRKVKELSEYNVVALLHHHFYLFPEIAREVGDSSLVRNYADLINSLKNMNVKNVLHGHKHFDLERPFITEDYYNTTESIINVFAGGSAGTARKDKHTFSVIDFYEKKDDIKVIHNKFVYNDEKLEPIIKKQIPPQNAENRIFKLLEMLGTINPDAHKAYTRSAEKIFKIYRTCDEIIKWVSQAITGFNDVYKCLDNDYRNILFLLYAINYRTLSNKAIIGKETSYFESASNILKELFNDQLATTEFFILDEEYHSLFRIKRLKDLAAICDQLLNKATNKTTELYLAFSMVGILFTDLYLVLTEYADDFKESIKYKINIKIEENEFHENVPATRIVLQSDADRRSAYIQLLCNDATAHKMAVLFVKEFDLVINKFEDYFKLIGLKIYYLIPKIHKDDMKNTIDNYNFEAYIPTLLPLLTGDNIYPSKVVFSRELIQNSIDAISVREEKSETGFSKKIFIEIGRDENNRRYFKIKDNGTGMDRYKIERYFTSIGRSFYSGDEYEDLNITYKPISNFGIGFLSSFMVCKEIDVKTKYYTDNSEGLKLNIPNYDGCFFIERGENIDIGTELKLYLNHELDAKQIVEYINKVMLDIKYDINIKIISEKNEETICIPAHQIRKNTKEELRLFIPFTENGEILNIDYDSEILDKNFIDKYEYGLLIQSHRKQERGINQKVLNAGILVEETDLKFLFGEDFNKKYSKTHLHYYKKFYNDIIINFPSNWIQIDVSREKLTGFSDFIKKLSSKGSDYTVGVRIAESLYRQLQCIIEHNKKIDTNLPVIYLQEVIQYAINFCGKNNMAEINKKLSELRYILNVKFTNEGIIYEIAHKGKDKRVIDSYYENKQVKQIYEKILKKHIPVGSRGTKLYLRDIYRVLEHATFSEEGSLRNKLNHLLNEFKCKPTDKEYMIYYLFTFILLNMQNEILTRSNISMSIDKQKSIKIESDREISYVISVIELIMMEDFRVFDVENGRNNILIKYQDLSAFYKMQNEKIKVLNP